MSFFSTLLDWASVLVSSDPVAARKRRELREVHAALKDVRPAIYNSRSRLLLPSFASALHELSSATRVLRDLLEKTLLSPDGRAAKRSRDLLLERSFDAGTRRLLESVSYDAMAARIAGGEDAREVFSSAEADYRLILKVLEGVDVRAAEAEAGEFEALAELCRYDAGRLLRAFDPAAKPESASYKPRFKAADGPTLAGELEDLYAAILAVRIGPSALDIAVALAAGTQGDPGLRRLGKDLQDLSRIISGILSPAVLAALLKALQEDPRYAPALADRPYTLIADYRARLSRRWTEDRERLLRELKERSLSEDVEALFGSAPAGGVMAAIGYDETLDARLREVLGKSLLWVRPLAYCKTFASRKLSGGLLDGAHRISVEGFFHNQVLRSRLTDAVGTLEKMGARIAAFEEGAAGNARSGAPALRAALEELAAGRGRAEAAERIAAGLDDRVKNMVAADLAALRSLAECLADILKDFKRPTPELVGNIKTLALSRDRALIPTLVAGYNDIARFLKIMQAYAVVPALQVSEP